jgi:CheY-like chemotaxis protein
MQAAERTILIVDDDRAIRLVLGEALEDEGYQVAHAATAFDGMARIAVGGVDLVLLDERLPDFAGVEFCAQVRRRERERTLLHRPSRLPIIVLTALEGPRQEAAFAAGCDDWVAKPFDLDDLLARIERLLPTR